MPQIWLTYDELGALLECSSADARRIAAALPLDRRRSRDGLTRTKLTHELAAVFLDRLLQERLEAEIAACASDLDAMRARMARLPAPTRQTAKRLTG